MTNNNDLQDHEYAKFWIRSGAYITDGLLLFVLTFPLTYWNVMHVKSFLLYLFTAIIGVCYKPLMEYYYSATVGKMAFNLKVTDLNYKRIGLHQSFLRSFILIFPMLLYIPLYYMAFNNPELLNAGSFMEFGEQLAYNYPFLQGLITKLVTVTFIVDLTFIIVDNNRTARTLHDRIGKTYVIKVRNNNRSIFNI